MVSLREGIFVEPGTNERERADVLQAYTDGAELADPSTDHFALRHPTLSSATPIRAGSTSPAQRCARGISFSVSPFPVPASSRNAGRSL